MGFAGGLWLLAVGFVLGTAFGTTLAALLRRRAAGDAPATPAVARDESHEEDEASFVDPSTGLASRRYVEMFLRRELSRSERLRRPVSVAVFDLDGFRVVAERVGQDAIDTALAEMGDRLRSELREYDVVGRYSDGRLIVALPESSVDQAFEAAERLAASVATLRLAGSPISLSVGVATFPDHASDADGLINSAHHALNRGRASSTAGHVHCCEELERAS
jgi:two-component system cell cycle response regulator